MYNYIIYIYCLDVKQIRNILFWINLILDKVKGKKRKISFKHYLL